MPIKILMHFMGRNLPKIRQPRPWKEPSIVNEKTLRDFTRVVDETGILAAPPRLSDDQDSDGN
jgi:hypothetical protein